VLGGGSNPLATELLQMIQNQAQGLVQSFIKGLGGVGEHRATDCLRVSSISQRQLADSKTPRRAENPEPVDLI